MASSGAYSTQHLKRLLVMVFQKAFPEPQEERDEYDNSTWTSRSFCLGCGECHVSEAIRARLLKAAQQVGFSIASAVECGP